MQDKQVSKPIKMNLDASLKYLPQDSAYYLLNHERNLTGSKTLGKFTPMPSNYKACEMEDVAGTPYGVGSFRDPITNEVYEWVLNDGGINYILRLNGDGTCEVVYSGACLQLSADPKHSIEQWRAYLKYDQLCAHRHGKALIWVNGDNEQIGMLDVEASIATNNFTTPFFDICPDPCALTQMCVPLSCTQIEAEFVTLDAADIDLTNHLLDVAVQLCYRFVYYDERVSEWMGVSTTYYQDSKTCFDILEGFPRCLKFRLPVGNPMVDRIEVAVRRDNELWTDGLSPLWKSVEVVEKYQPYSSQSQMWYERSLASLLNFSETDCAFDYIFCNDKECNPISVDDTNRVYNPEPIQPQGIIRLKDSLGFYNYKKGNCPLSGTETEKFEISIECDNLTVCTPELVDVTIYAIVYNQEQSKGGFVYRIGGTTEGQEDDPEARENTDAAWFGRADGQGAYLQYFKNKARNFIVYIEGTEYWAEMEQLQCEPFFANSYLHGIVSGMGNNAQKNIVLGAIDNGNFFLQRATIKVPKGTRGFARMTSHRVDTGLGGNQDTSTQVIGTIPDIHAYTGSTNLDGLVNSDFKEIYIDTCYGAFSTFQTLVVVDNYTNFSNGNHSASAYSGYLRDANNKPVEFAEIWENAQLRATTDWNGFYNFFKYGGVSGNITIEVLVEQNCAAFSSVKTLVIAGGYRMTQTDIQITDINNPTYKSNFYEIVNVYVKDCSSNPVAGIRVAMSGSKYAISDVSGAATFYLRNKSTRNRQITSVVVNTNGYCFNQACDDSCNPCSPVTSTVLLSACFMGTPYLDLLPTTLLNIDTAEYSKRGLKAGGRYPFGIVVKYPCNKISAVYPITILNGSLEMPDNYINIPKTQDKGALNFCRINYRGNGITLPIGASCLSIVRGENVNRFELQWVVDKIDRTPDNKIKLTIQSLNDYNASYNFETNTTYQYRKNDRVEFIANGNNEIFDSATYGLLNYQILSPYNDVIISGQTNSPADFFNQILIEDDGKLDGLIIGAKIELQRPRDCTVEPTYYEVYSIPIDENGHLVTNTGTFNTFDTFFINRKIGKNTSQIFEHHSPSDHWGNRINDGGKVHFVNRFENERRFGRNISFNSATRFNIFGFLEKTLDAPEQGDIVSMGVYDGKVGLGIAEHDNFLFQISDDFLRVGNDGIVRAASADSLISDGQVKVSGIFGCQYPHIGSVYYGDGFVMFWDVNKSALVKHDFNMAKDVSEGKARLYFDTRGQFIENFNKTAATDIQKFRMISGFNFNTNAYILTVKALNQGGTNNSKELFGQTNDTILFQPVTEDFLTFAGFTPERYSNIDLFDGNGCAFVSFQNGIPYIHPKISLSDTDYNTFFGTSCDWVIAVSLNKDQTKIKVPISMEIESEDMFFATKVITDKVGFESEIPPIRWKKTERKWNASFLFDKNSRGGLYGTDPRVAGTVARGYFVGVVLCRDNTTNLIYNSTNINKMSSFGELDMILIKYNFSEQSGYDQNL